MDYDTANPPPSGAPQGQRQGMPSGQEVRGAAAAVGDAVKDEYRALRDEAAQQVHATAETAKREAHDYAETQREAAGAGIGAFATALQAGASSLDEEGQRTAASFGHQAAASVQDLADWVQNRSVGELWQEAQRYTRQQPGVAFGGAVAAGFFLARFLKSSTPAPRNDTRGYPYDAGVSADRGTEQANYYGAPDARGPQNTGG
jgi:hypothetical protein